MSASAKDVPSIEWDDPVDAIEQMYELGWTDGLPVVPPTEERVGQFLEVGGRPAKEVVGAVPDRRPGRADGRRQGRADRSDLLVSHDA